MAGIQFERISGERLLSANNSTFATEIVDRRNDIPGQKGLFSRTHDRSTTETEYRVDLSCWKEGEGGIFQSTLRIHRTAIRTIASRVGADDTVILGGLAFFISNRRPSDNKQSRIHLRRDSARSLTWRQFLGLTQRRIQDIGRLRAISAQRGFAPFFNRLNRTSTTYHDAAISSNDPFAPFHSAGHKGPDSEWRYCPILDPPYLCYTLRTALRRARKMLTTSFSNC